MNQLDYIAENQRLKKELKKIKTEKQIGCEYCDDDGFCPPLDWKYGLDHIFPDYKYCPICGRKLYDVEGEHND